MDRGATREIPRSAGESADLRDDCMVGISKDKGYGAPGEIRTPGLFLRREALYPAELRAHTGANSLHAVKNRHQLRESPAPASAAVASSITAIAPTATTPSASTTAASAPSAEAASSSAPAAGTIGFGARFVDVERASADFRAVDGGDGFLAFFGISHFNESEAARPSGVAIGHDADSVHLTVGRKQLTQFFFSGVEVQIAYKNIFQASGLELSYLNVSDVGKVGWFTRIEKPELRTVKCGRKYSRSLANGKLFANQYL